MNKRYAYEIVPERVIASSSGECYSGTITSGSMGCSKPVKKVEKKKVKRNPFKGWTPEEIACYVAGLNLANAAGVYWP